MKEKIIEKTEQLYTSFNDSELLLQIANKNKPAFEEFFNVTAEISEFTQSWTRLLIKAYN